MQSSFLKRFAALVALTLYCALSIACGGGGGGNIVGSVSQPGAITVSSNNVNFGNVAVGQTSTLGVTVTNTGGQALSISGVAVTGTGFSITPVATPLSLNPNSSVNVSISFAPTSVAAFTGAVVVSSGSNTTTTINLSGSGITPPPIAVGVTAANTLTGVNSATVLTATVTNTANTTVTWSSTPSGGVSFTAAPQGSPANSISFSANAPGVYAVKATSAADPTKSATINVSVISISISPSSATIGTAGQQIYQATVTGASGIPVAFSATGGTFAQNQNTGTYTPPAAAGTYTVTVAAVNNPNIKAQATINVVQFSLSPSSVTLLTSGLRTGLFTVTTSAPNPTVTFSASGGTFTPSGLTANYTAPVTAGVYTLTATLDANPSISATATINVIIPAVTIYEVDGVTQTSRPISFGRVFAQGDIPNCPQPVVGGTPSTNYQADVKGRWPDGSVKYAIVTFIQTLAANSGTEVTFQNNASCNNSGFLTQSQMANFNSGNWGAQMDVAAPGSTTVTTDAKTMLAANDPATNSFGDCKNNYWQQGPVVTTVILQDCTATSQFDFGWSWNGTAMTSPTTGTASTATFHPMYVLHFYPSINTVEVEYIMELPWINKIQNQMAAYTFKAGSPLATVWSQPAIEHIGGSRARKVFYSGTPLGTIRIDHNFPYMKFTKAVPNYDSFVSISPDTGGNDNNGVTSWAQWLLGDKGEVGGNGGLNSFDKDFSANSEGAPLQREDLLYLYNMSSCGTPNGACAKAWQMLTADSGASDTSLTAGKLSGGGGTWNNIGNVPFHWRESRTTANAAQNGVTNFFYCPGYDDKNALGNGSSNVQCNGSGATNNARGKALSRHAHTNVRIDDFGTVGRSTVGGWFIGNPSCDHWFDYAYMPYMLTGSYFFLEENYFAASYCLSTISDGANTYQSNTFYGFINPEGAGGMRAMAWSLQAMGRASFMAPDGTPEQLFYRSMLKSNMAVQEGIMNIVGTSLTPTDTRCSAASLNNYDLGNTNRWNWGRCTVVSRCLNFGTGTCNTQTPALRSPTPGGCPANPTYLNAAVTSTATAPWHIHYLNVILSELREMGFSEVVPVSDELQKALMEQVQDSTYNPYLIANYLQGVRDAAGGSPCDSNGGNVDPYISTYARLRQSALNPDQATFDHNNEITGFACADHGYSVIARAAGAYLPNFNNSASNPNCPNGTCTAAGTWAWMQAEIPYFSNTPLHSAGCGASDQQIKYAIAPR